MTADRDPATPAEAAWARTTWEGNARWRAERVLEATPYERLLWLESALELAARAGALPRRGPEPGSEVTTATSPSGKSPPSA